MGEINGQAFEKARENTYLDVSKSDLRAFVEEYELAKRPAQPRVCNDAELQAAVVRYSQAAHRRDHRPALSSHDG